MSLNSSQLHSTNNEAAQLQQPNDADMRHIQNQLEELQRMQAELLHQRAQMQPEQQPSKSYISRALEYRIKVSHLLYLLGAAYVLKKAYDIYTFQEVDITEPEELSWAQWAFNGAYNYVATTTLGLYALYNKRWNIGVLNKIENGLNRLKGAFSNSRAGILIFTTASRAPLVGRLVTQEQASEPVLEIDEQIKRALLNGLGDLDILNHPERMRFDDGKIIINDPFIMREITSILMQENPNEGSSHQNTRHPRLNT